MREVILEEAVVAICKKGSMSTSLSDRGKNPENDDADSQNVRII